MKKLKTFLIFLTLVATWAAFFSTIKFFVWGDLETTIEPNLQQIAGYMSLGGIFAYLIGGAFAATFLKKYYLFIISLLSLIFISYAYLIGFKSGFEFAIFIVIIGFLYGLWNVVKNVIAVIEIEKTGLAETIVNAVVGITFVIFIIIGSIIGNILSENMGHNGYIVIIGMLIFTLFASLSLDYDKISFKSLIKNGFSSYYLDRKNSLKKSLSLFIPDLKFIVKNYSLIIIVSSFLWAISTIVSQVSVEFSVEKFEIEKSTATYLLLYSATGAIIGNIFSMKMNKKRWLFFSIFNSLFALTIISFPFLAITYNSLVVLAIILGIFFGISSNLIDSYLLKRIGAENKKEYGSSTYGLVLSMAIFVLMFISSSIQEYYGYKTLMIFLALLMFSMGLLLIKNHKKY